MKPISFIQSNSNNFPKLLYLYVNGESIMRPTKGSTELKKCLYCGEVMEKAKTQSWPTYQNRKKFCGQSCGTKHQFRNGYPKETIEKRVKTYKEKGHTSWNSGNVTIKQCVHCGDDFKAPGIRKDIALYCSMGCRSEFSYKNKDKNKERYYLKVWKITNRQPLNTLKDFELRGKAKKGTNNHQIDHIIPIIEGYKNNISPDIIGNINNLRMLHWKENIGRNKNEQ
jgi:hypothetical protein